MEIFASKKKGSTVVQAVVVLVVAAVLTDGAAAQQECASKLTACQEYINGTGKPPASCCGPLKEAVTQDMPCLCAIYNNTDILKAFNINITLAQLLPARCGFSSDAHPCSNSTATTSPPPTPRGNNSAGRHVLTCFKMSLFLLWWSIVA